jgi:replicative DNA helicase
MIELQILNKILKDGNLSLLVDNGIDSKYFNKFKLEYNFILNHYQSYSVMPDQQTILSNKDLAMEFFDVKDSPDYLIKALKEDRLFNETVVVLKKIGDLMVEDSVRAVELLRAEMPKLSQQVNANGVDITKDISRLKVIEDKQQGVSQVIKTGLPELDELIYGWMPGEELATIVARTGQGKTWLLLWFMVAAWKQGKRVGIYSGEMTDERIGYRIDTIINHFSNKDLVRGTIPNLDGYKQYLNGLKNSTTPFFVISKKQLGGRATVTRLRHFAEANNLDILGVDQYTLLEDERGSKNASTREQLEHISSDLFDLSCDLKIPVVVLSQANRGGVRNDKEGGTPDVENIYGADAIAQNATKVITIRQTGAGFELTIKKNRDDRVGDTLLYFWDIDNGIMKYIPNSQDSVRNPGKIEEVRSQFNDKRDVF